MFLHYTVIYLFLNHDSLNLAICVNGAHGVWEGGVCVSTCPSVYMYLCENVCLCEYMTLYVCVIVCPSKCNVNIFKISLFPLQNNYHFV